MKRLHQIFEHPETNGSSVHWNMLKEHVLKHTGLEPFSQVDDVEATGFKYLNSSRRSERFEIYGCDAPYAVTDERVSETSNRLPPGTGPVEIDVASFVLDPRPDLGVLIGGMGSGKSTTFRQVARWLAPDIRVHYLNCDKTVHDAEDPPPALELLVRFLHRLLAELIDPEEEFGACWDWAFEQYGRSDRGDHHSAVGVLEPAVEELRETYGRDWRRNDPDAVLYRRKHLHRLVCSNPRDKLQYVALRLDYVLSVQCRDRRNLICIVLDNVDPLPPQLQRELLLCTSQLQLNARCKVMLAMRPLTYSLTHGQRANRTVKVLQHIGPTALALIEDRIVRLIESQELPGLRLRAQAAGAPERELNAHDFKAWVRQVLQDVRDARSPGGAKSPAPNASDFVEGLCNNSLRSALLVAEKIFGSPNLPMVIPDEPGGDGPHVTLLKSHEIIRAVMLGRHVHYASDINRVTDNLFDLGDAAACHSLTCKYRILKELTQAPGRGILPVAELATRLRAFGYDDAVLLESINGVISQVKRLAWSDMVVVYRSLTEPAGSRLSISRAGRFYANHAVHSLEYVQEVHVDVALPDSVCGKTYNHLNFTERFNSLYRFISHLHDVDSREVKLAMSDPVAQRRYAETYGDKLFSSEIAKSIAQQVLAIGNSRLRRLSEGHLRYATEQALQSWSGMEAHFARLDEDVVRHLKLLQPAR